MQLDVDNIKLSVSCWVRDQEPARWLRLQYSSHEAPGSSTVLTQNADHCVWEEVRWTF